MNVKFAFLVYPQRTGNYFSQSLTVALWSRMSWWLFFWIIVEIHKSIRITSLYLLLERRLHMFWCRCRLSLPLLLLLSFPPVYSSLISLQSSYYLPFSVCEIVGCLWRRDEESGISPLRVDITYPPLAHSLVSSYHIRDHRSADRELFHWYY